MPSQPRSKRKTHPLSGRQAARGLAEPSPSQTRPAEAQVRLGLRKRPEMDGCPVNSPTNSATDPYFCRLDKLSGDPREARLPRFAKRVRTLAFQGVFGDRAHEVVDAGEERLRGTTYVCCWTRREHESYLAWKHYCPSSGGIAVQTSWRHLEHLYSALHAKDAQMHCRAVGYLDPLLDDLPDHSEGEQVFWKSHWFSDEREIRFAVLRDSPLSRPIFSYF